MSGVRQFRLVDVFAEQPYMGNIAGVVLDADGLEDGQLQAIAREINAPATAFLLGGNDLHRPPLIRWFSPTDELTFCGHATLAAAYAVATALHGATMESILEQPVVFQSPHAGKLLLRAERLAPDRDTLLWWLPMADVAVTAENLNPVKLCNLLGLGLADLTPGVPVVRTVHNDVIVLIQKWQRLVELQPDFQQLAAWSHKHGIRGFCVSTTESVSQMVHVTSRFFAPAAGIPEDPVTGSVHGPLAGLLVERGLVPFDGQRAALNCMQGEPSGRSGMVRAMVTRVHERLEVAIAGSCQLTVRGELSPPAVAARPAAANG